MSVKNIISNERQTKYAVIRNGMRVSDSEYLSRDEAKSEYDHWNKVITRWPDGSKLEIVEVKGK
jgi:hypothetical protein